MKTVVIAAVLIALAFTFVPIGVIWSLNTLFKLGLEFTFANWLAALILSAIIHGTTK